MPRFFSVLMVIACLWAGVPVMAHAAEEAPAAAAKIVFKKDSLTIKSATGKSHPFVIEIADNNEQREEGLKHRKELPEDHGMLFIFEEDTYVEMWMKDTPISLDILFIDSHGKEVFITPKTKPDSTDIISARRDARAVLELAAGVAEKQGIKVGDQVVYSYFKP